MTLGIEISRLWRCLTVATIAIDLSACESLSNVSSRSEYDRTAVSSSVSEFAGSDDVRSSSPLQLGLQHFNRGDYGLAERYFRDAVEKSPKDAAAWIGLAASYDQIRRFDLADRAYRMAITLSGETAQILNNQAYSYMLRGNYGAARARFRKAQRLDRNNLTIINNIEILNSRERSRPRSP